MLTPKENYFLAAVEHNKPEWVPNEMTDVLMAGGLFETFENGPLGGGKDDFGVEWHTTTSGAGQPVPCGRLVLDDIANWESVVKFPNLDEYDWAGQSAFQLSMGDRSKQAVEYGLWNGQFLRITHLMGFENALCSLYLDPDAWNALMNAITNYKIKVVERVAEYFKPDIITNYIDVATENSLFMAPDIYRTLISPHQKRLNDAIKSLGIIPFVHCCGKCEDVIKDFIDEGFVAWSSAQPMNDISGVLKRYGDRISVIGGYDTNGKPGSIDATEEDIDLEVKRCMDSYASYGSYVFMGFKLVNSADMNDFFAALGPINAAAEKYGKTVR